MNSLEKKLVVGLEIGTMKVISLIGEKCFDGSINIIGIGQCISTGMYKGNINDLESVVKCIQDVINQAENMAKCQISSINLSLSGQHISCQNEIGIVPIAKNEVTQEDIEKVIYTAKSIKINDNSRILHVIPQEYSIDNQDKIKNPLGLSGIRLKTKVHLITCNNNMAKNMIKAVEYCGIKVNQIIFSGLASSLSIIRKEEIESGVCLVDIGAGTMDITIYTNGSIRYTKVLPYAGNIVTNDIAYAFNISFAEAEKIKIQFGSINLNNYEKEENIHDSNKITQTINKHTLIKVIEPRYKELLTLINYEILKLQEKLKTQGIQYNLSSGIILTGGASQIDGLLEYAQKMFNNQIKIGAPLNINCLETYNFNNPIYATVTGLLNYKKKYYLNSKFNYEKKNLSQNWLKKIKNWFKKEF